VIVHFETREDMNLFADLVQQKINITTPSIWYPAADIAKGQAITARTTAETLGEPRTRKLMEQSVQRSFAPNLSISPNQTIFDFIGEEMFTGAGEEYEPIYITGPKGEKIFSGQYRRKQVPPGRATIARMPPDIDRVGGGVPKTDQPSPLLTTPNLINELLQGQRRTTTVPQMRGGKLETIVGERKKSPEQLRLESEEALKRLREMLYPYLQSY